MAFGQTPRWGPAMAATSLQNTQAVDNTEIGCPVFQVTLHTL
jgi:hypothetical protein